MAVAGTQRATSWELRDRRLDLSLPHCAGIVNVTEDSFFSGARSGTPQRAIEDGVGLVSDGFEMLDVGAVAARAGDPVDAGDEIARLIPAVEGLTARTEVPLSADTFSPQVARAAVAAGAEAVNDIGGG